MSLPGKVVRIVLLNVPFLSRIEDIVTPSHHLAGLHRRRECLGLHRHFRVLVLGSTREELQRTLVCSPRLKLYHPVLADVLVRRVVMHVFLLRMIDPCDLLSVLLTVPDVRVKYERSTRSLI